MSNEDGPNTMRTSDRQRQWLLNPGHGIAHARLSTESHERLTQGGGADIVNRKYSCAPPTTTVDDKGGFRMVDCTVYFLFWGSAWKTATTPSMQDLVNDFASILASPYLLALSQYGSPGQLGSASFGGAWWFHGGIEPRDNFLDSDISAFTTESIDFNGIPFPQFALYMVLLPPGIRPLDKSHDGNHSFILDISLDWVNFAWVQYASRPEITAVFTHELVEAMTDPHGYGVQVNPSDLVNWNEIGDVCEGCTDTLNGVTVQAYWSQAHRACIIPREVPVRTRQITCIRKHRRDDPAHAIKFVSGTSVESGETFTVLQEQCIRDIDRGMRYFVVGDDGSVANVRVGIHFPTWQPLGSRYIITVADDTKRDNLLSLPECPPGPLDRHH
jgi:Protein of unknown function (DUF3892)